MRQQMLAASIVLSFGVLNAANGQIPQPTTNPSRTDKKASISHKIYPAPAPRVVQTLVPALPAPATVTPAAPLARIATVANQNCPPVKIPTAPIVVPAVPAPPPSVIITTVVSELTTGRLIVFGSEDDVDLQIIHPGGKTETVGLDAFYDLPAGTYELRVTPDSGTLEMTLALRAGETHTVRFKFPAKPSAAGAAVNGTQPPANPAASPQTEKATTPKDGAPAPQIPAPKP